MHNSPCLIGVYFLKVIVKEVLVFDYMSLFPNEDVLTKEEIESWRSFVDSLSSSEDRELFETLLNDCYNYPAAISAMGEPVSAEALLMTLLLL